MTKIIAAAIKRGEIVFFISPPARHHTILHALDKSVYRPKDIIQPHEQGFITDEGKFISREEAKELVKTNGQKTIADYNSTQLFSEDLW